MSSAAVAQQRTSGVRSDENVLEVRKAELLPRPKAATRAELSLDGDACDASRQAAKRTADGLAISRSKTLPHSASAAASCAAANAARPFAQPPSSAPQRCTRLMRVDTPSCKAQARRPGTRDLRATCFVHAVPDATEAHVMRASRTIMSAERHLDVVAAVGRDVAAGARLAKRLHHARGEGMRGLRHAARQLARSWTEPENGSPCGPKR